MTTVAPVAAPAAAPVISAYHAGKRFITHRRRATSLKERVVRRERATVDGEFWALKDLSLEIAPGETVGLIGHNGSGKSTTLKLLAGILQPTTGSVHVLGRVSSLLELGAGFNPELTGRDNVYLNASLLGLSRTTVDGLFEQIVDFSELGDRIEDPVKAYSSGMYVKLGFSVAVHVDPDILLVDEVLAVGDEAFQEKCLDKIKEFQQAGKTILVVSHALDQVSELCTRAVVLDHGESQWDGDPFEAVRIMRDLIGTTKAPAVVEPEPEPEPEPVPEPEPLEALRVTIPSVLVSSEPGGEPRYVFHPGDPLTVRVEVEVTETGPVETVEVTAVLMGPWDLPLRVMHGGGEGTLPCTPGPHQVDFRLDRLPELVGPYSVAVSLRDGATGAVVSARTFEGVFALPGERAHGLLDTRYDVLPVLTEPHPVPAPAPSDGPAYEPLAGAPVETPA